MDSSGNAPSRVTSGATSLSGAEASCFRAQLHRKSATLLTALGTRTYFGYVRSRRAKRNVYRVIVIRLAFEGLFDYVRKPNTSDESPNTTTR